MIYFGKVWWGGSFFHKLKIVQTLFTKWMSLNKFTYLLIQGNCKIGNLLLNPGVHFDPTKNFNRQTKAKMQRHPGKPKAVIFWPFLQAIIGNLCARKNIYRRIKWKKTLKSPWLWEIPVASKVTASCSSKELNWPFCLKIYFKNNLTNNFMKK